MAHRSCLAGFIIDCKTDDAAPAAEFWGRALGAERQAGDGGYVTLAPQAGLNVEVQAVDHAPRVHLDIETDDIEAEVARLEGLGAMRFKDVGGWVVMQAPTGHRFCVVAAASETFAARATLWEDA